MASDGPATGADDRLAKARRRAKTMRAERDAARRAAEGAEARIAQTQTRLAELEAELEAAREQIESLTDEVEDTRRRSRSQVESTKDDVEQQRLDLQRKLKAARRENEELRTENERLRAAVREATTAETEQRPTGHVRHPDEQVATRDARYDGTTTWTSSRVLDLLLGAEHVVIDGYNVTKRFHANLPLEQQRRWLVDQLSSVLGRAAGEWVIFFDGSGGSHDAAPHARGLRIEFSPDGVSADDDIDLYVAATNPGERIVVVTDDRELRARVSVSGADIVRSGEFVGALR